MIPHFGGKWMGVVTIVFHILDKEVVGRIGLKFGSNSLRQKMNSRAKIDSVKFNGESQ